MRKRLTTTTGVVGFASHRARQMEFAMGQLASICRWTISWVIGVVVFGVMGLSIVDVALAQIPSSAAESEPFDSQELNGHNEDSTPLSDEELVGDGKLIAATRSLEQAIKGDSSRNEQTKHRLLIVGLYGGTFLLLLGVLFAYLRMDHATRGFYSGRLQMVAVACSILILTVCYVLWTHVLFK